MNGKMVKNEKISCFKTQGCCIYSASQCLNVGILTFMSRINCMLNPGCACKVLKPRWSDRWMH